MKSSIIITNQSNTRETNVSILPSRFQRLVLTWFDCHGRKHLPWQQQKTPYRVWISEVMLQQTQVTTVIPYFKRFIKTFPSVKKLAEAHVDEVLHLWSGLGYYSRARNLHLAAQAIMAQYHGKFPSSLEEWQRLPGIGSSTAGAIVAIAFNQRAAILDGNVKRVLSRFLGITEPINDKHVEAILWDHANRYTPSTRVADYTQAMMDLGATLCTRNKPQCEHCPLTNRCIARQQGLVNVIPIKKRTRALPTKEATFIVLQKGSHVFLHKRPDTGIWGGLWSLPEIPGKADQKMIKVFCHTQFNLHVSKMEAFDSFNHTFSHYRLIIYPVRIQLGNQQFKITPFKPNAWYDLNAAPSLGLPQPVKFFLRNL